MEDAFYGRNRFWISGVGIIQDVFDQTICSDSLQWVDKTSHGLVEGSRGVNSSICISLLNGAPLLRCLLTSYKGSHFQYKWMNWTHLKASRFKIRCPVSDCKEANIIRSFGSRLMINWTAPLHTLQTPSNKMKWEGCVECIAIKPPVYLAYCIVCFQIRKCGLEL